MRRILSKNKRHKIYQRDNFQCQYCKYKKENPDSKKLAKDERTIDHVIPLARDGTNAIENLITACPAHNKQKSNQTLELFCEKSKIDMNKIKQQLSKIPKNYHFIWHWENHPFSKEHFNNHLIHFIRKYSKKEGLIYKPLETIPHQIHIYLVAHDNHSLLFPQFTKKIISQTTKSLQEKFPQLSSRIENMTMIELLSFEEAPIKKETTPL